MIDITVPAFDTPTGALSPIVIDAIADGATAVPHDQTSFIVRFEDKKKADVFEAAINAILNPKKAK